MLFYFSIFILYLINNTVICDYSYWQNGESPIIFNDPPSVQERTNFPFHNVQFESNYPLQRSYVVEIPNHEKPPTILDETQPTIGDKLNALLPDQNEKEKVLEIVDSRCVFVDDVGFDTNEVLRDEINSFVARIRKFPLK